MKKYSKIDFRKKIISYNPKNTRDTFTARELYSFLQDAFDEPENMKYDIPIVARSKNDFQLINGWSIENKSLKYLKGGTISNSA